MYEAVYCKYDVQSVFAAEAACAVEVTTAEDTAAIFRIKVEEESRRRGSFLDEGTGGEAID